MSDVSAVVRVQHVERGSNVVAEGLAKRDPVLRIAQPIEGLVALIAFGECGPPKRDRLADAGVDVADDGTITSSANFHAHGIERWAQRCGKVGRHRDGLDRGLDLFPLSIDQVAAAVLLVETLEVQVLHVRREIRPAPGNVLVLAENHHRQPHQRHAGGMQAFPLLNHRIPERRHLQPEVRIVGQDGRAIAGQLSGDDPGVAADMSSADLQLFLDTALQPPEVSQASDVLVIRRAIARKGPRSVFPGEKKLRLRRAQGLLRHILGSFLVEIAGQIEGEYLGPGERVDRRPALGLHMEQLELARQGMLFAQPGIDARRIRRQRALRRLAQRPPG